MTMSASRHINAGQSDRSQMHISFSAKFAAILEGVLRNRKGVVLHFRPVSSQFKMDHGFIQAANLTGSTFLS